MRRVINVDKEGFINLNQFDDLLDISKVVYYEITNKNDGSFAVSFYDENEQPVPLYVGK